MDDLYSSVRYRAHAGVLPMSRANGPIPYSDRGRSNFDWIFRKKRRVVGTAYSGGKAATPSYLQFKIKRLSGEDLTLFLKYMEEE